MQRSLTSEFMSIDEVGELIRMPSTWVLEQITLGLLASYQFQDTTWRVRLADVENFVERFRVRGEFDPPF